MHRDIISFVRRDDALERSGNFKEVNLGYSLADALAEAERCIMCSKAACIEGCPVSIDIPRFLRHLVVRDLDGALEVIKEANAFPSICGRVCPQESQCEAQCVIRAKVEPVAIGRLERFVGDNARARPAAPPTFERKLGRVAICGSGPATSATIASVALPEMRRYRYDLQLATGCIAAGGGIGMLIPPSIVFIVYGILTDNPSGNSSSPGSRPAS